MLLSDTAQLHRQASAYLHTVLGADVAIKPWPETGGLPYFLQDAYDWAEFELLDRRCIAFTPKRPTALRLSELRQHAAPITRTQPNAMPVLLMPALNSFERRHLVEQHMSFIVPGNQLYLPELGLDLREYFRRQRETAARTPLSPATQALLISALLRRPWQDDWHAADDAARLGYTAMTASRAIRELKAASLIQVSDAGPARRVHFAKPPEQVWHDAEPVLRNPVRRQVQVGANHPVPEEALRAGTSALAAQTMLADPSTPVWAVNAVAWRRAKARGMVELPLHSNEAAIWQIWSYGPKLLPEDSPGARNVDPLSLMLSFKDDPDERIQTALNELKGTLPWPLRRD